MYTKCRAIFTMLMMVLTIIAAQAGSVRAGIVTSAEYYIDTDPGQGSGTALSSSDGSFNSTLENVQISLDTSNLTVGVHNFYIRMKNDAGDWGTPRKVMFNVDGERSIIAQEYFIDTDPGEGLGTSLDAVDGLYNQSREEATAAIDTSSLTAGLHALYVRAKDAEGKWGTPRLHTIEITGQPILAAMEYYVDTDPGTGNGAAMTSLDGSFYDIKHAAEAFLDTTSLNYGPHTIYARAKNSFSIWGSTQSVNFMVQPYLTVSKTGTGGGTITSDDTPQSINCGGSCTAPMTYGQAVVLTATSDAQSVFSGWSGCPGPSGNTCVATMDSSQTIQATFSSKTTASISAPYITYGDNGTVTVTVSSPYSTPVGTVSLSVDGGAATTQAVSAVNGSNPPAASAVFTITKPNAGDHTLSASFSSTTYEASSASGTLTVNAKILTVTATAANKVYDGTTSATVTYSDDRVAGDTLTVSGTAAFVDKNVGTGKTVNVTGIGVAGVVGGNYVLAANFTTATANITAKNLTITGMTASSKVYDGTTAATLNGGNLTGLVAGDAVSFSGQTGTFIDKNVGTGKAVSVTGIALTGTDAGNYTVSNPTGLTANITQKSLIVTATAANKVYDGSTTATVTFSDNRINGDIFSVSGTSVFSDKNVGAGKTVSITGITITGTDAGNYSMTSTSASASADITLRALTVTTSGVNKVYDGTTSATVSNSDNRVAGDILTATGTATFANKNTGTGKTISVTGISITGTDAGNYNLSAITASTTADITARPLTITATASNKVFDGTTSATATLADNRVAGDILTGAFTTATFANKNVGTGKTVTVSSLSITGTDSGNYILTATTVTTTANITPKTVSVTATGVNKVYDGTTAATITYSDNRIAGDIFTATGTATFANKNAGTGKTVSVTGISITGTDAGNYNLTATTASTTADITPKSLAVTAAGTNKVYDGTTTATVTLADNRVSGDILTATGTATFANKNAGTGKTVSVTGIAISGTDAGNYNLTATTASTTADITARPLTITVTASNKVYDGTTSATATLADNRITGDILTGAFTTATFANKNVGTGKTVTVSSLSITGTDAGNYSLTSTTASTTANITVKTLTLTATGTNRVYDGTTSATVTYSDDRITGDVLTISGTGVFANKNVGTGKTISVSGITISGTDSGNYALASTTATATADITPKSLTVTATGTNKVYDGTTTATVTLADNRVSGDILTATGTATFANKNAGTGKTVSVTGISITGTDAGNYNLTATTASTTADITPKSLAVTATGTNKVYDGTTSVTVSYSDNRVAGDILTATGTATFANKNTGTGKTISVTGISITGTDAGNYNLSATTASTTADITARPLTITATASNKVYDGATSATATLADNRVAGDILTGAFTTATFANKNVGTGKTVTVSGLSITGTDSGNYSLTATTATTTANITPKTVSVTATGVNKVYDGTTAATVTYSDNRIGGDILTATGTATFANKNAGTGKTVSVTGIAITGTDAGNYNLSATTATATADITPKSLTVTATGTNKVYDGTTSATVSYGDNRVAGDILTATGTATFANKNAGTGKTISITGIAISGTDAGNYNLTATTASTTADITARPLIITATASNKVYDGTVNATAILADNRIAGDILTGAFTTATFANKNIGTGKTVTVSSLSITGTDSGNYSLTATTVTTTANITPKTVSVTATGVNKVYDGTTAATIIYSDNRIAGDIFTATGTATFANKNAGTGKTVSVTGISITGTDAGNYNLTATTASATADITPKALTVTATGSNKVYDGTTAATVTLADNRVAGDILTATGTATFANKNAGTGKTVSVTGIAISGTDAGNYNLTATTASTTADITARPLTITATASNKVYDGTVNATATLADNRLAGDVLTISFTAAAFNNKSVGNGKTVTVSGLTISGTDAGNYSLATTTAATTANITAKALTVTGMTASNKVYDGNTVATLSGGSLVGIITGDTVSFSGQSGAFANKNVGTGKAVTVTGITLSGADAGNYTVSNPTGVTANITAKMLTATVTGVNKIYDGTTTATVTYGDDRIAGDTLTISGTAEYGNKNIGTNKAVSVTGISISGTDAGNYSLTATTASTTANITAKTLTFTATGTNKVYDGTTAATVTYGDNRVSGDVLTISGTAVFSDKNIGAGKVINVTGIAIAGTDAGNYSLTTTTAATSANITAKALTITGMNAANKTYDGTTSVSLSGGTLSGVISGDAVSFSGQSGTFASKTVGTSKTITVSGITLSGADAGNYTVSNPTGLTADITERVLTITVTGTDKFYDQSTTATVSYSDNRIAGDVLTVSGSAAFADKNIGDGKTIAITGIVLSGADAVNYSLAATTTTATANITAPDGDLDGSGVSVTDALRALRIAGGLITPTANDISHGDVAPLVSNMPQPDDMIDIGDVVVILRRSVGLVNW